MPLKRMQRRPAPKSLATKSYVKKVVKQSQELIDQAQTHAAENAAYDGVALQKISTPVAAQASGDKLVLSSIRVKCLFANPSSAGTVFVRMVAFQWYLDDATATPAFADIFNGSADATAVIEPIEDASVNNSVKAKILMDKVIKLGEATSVEGNDKAIRSYLFTARNVGRKIFRMTGTATGINHIYLMFVSNIADASSPPTVATEGQFYYREEAASN